MSVLKKYATASVGSRDPGKSSLTSWVLGSCISVCGGGAGSRRRHGFSTALVLGKGFPFTSSSVPVDRESGGYLAELLGERQKLVPFIQIFPHCNRLISQEIRQVSGGFNPSFVDHERLEHENPLRSLNQIPYGRPMDLEGWPAMQVEQAKWGTTEQIDRSILWKVARKDSSGNYVTECDKVMGEAIEEMLEQRKEGKLIEIETNDILTQVLGTAEHLGRVRGQSQGVTPRDYFHKPIGGGGLRGLLELLFEIIARVS
ncbi:uncharacterized protein LOC133779862 [Humulus lupulus]|uniref:uncharacterized protein LOC133779862 n=1 Tax=Humulus lupulus TaxID=3486 RepID=UPI002B40EE5C|nr:uncharacterized protein LOC133779862 [Humulus lupulus]